MKLGNGRAYRAWSRLIWATLRTTRHFRNALNPHRMYRTLPFDRAAFSLCPHLSHARPHGEISEFQRRTTPHACIHVTPLPHAPHPPLCARRPFPLPTPAQHYISGTYNRCVDCISTCNERMRLGESPPNSLNLIRTSIHDEYDLILFWRRLWSILRV
jgi:hypothetical protein